MEIKPWQMHFVLDFWFYWISENQIASASTLFSSVTIDYEKGFLNFNQLQHTHQSFAIKLIEECELCLALILCFLQTISSLPTSQLPINKSLCLYKIIKYCRAICYYDDSVNSRKLNAVFFVVVVCCFPFIASMCVMFDWCGGTCNGLIWFHFITFSFSLRILISILRPSKAFEHASHAQTFPTLFQTKLRTQSQQSFFMQSISWSSGSCYEILISLGEEERKWKRYMKMIDHSVYAIDRQFTLSVRY